MANEDRKQAQITSQRSTNQCCNFRDTWKYFRCMQIYSVNMVHFAEIVISLPDRWRGIYGDSFFCFYTKI